MPVGEGNEGIVLERKRARTQEVYLATHVYRIIEGGDQKLKKIKWCKTANFEVF